jgi:phage major head subunit gpT-like protein
MTAYADIGTALATANTTFKAGYEKIFKNDLPGEYRRYTKVIPGNGRKILEIGGLRENPVVRQWTGARQHKAVQAFKNTVTAVPYEATLDFTRSEVQYDSPGIVASRINAFLRETAYAYDKLAFAKLVSNPTAVDAVSLFSASHPYATSAGATQSNYSTNSLTFANFESARIAMESWTQANDEPLQARVTTLLCGPANSRKAMDICDAALRVVPSNQAGVEASSLVVDTAAISNVYQGKYTVVVDSRLVGDYAYYWFLLDESRGDDEKPIVLLEAMPFTTQQLTDLESSLVFETDKFSYGLLADLGLGADSWQCIYGNLATS